MGGLQNLTFANSSFQVKKQKRYAHTSEDLCAYLQRFMRISLETYAHISGDLCAYLWRLMRISLRTCAHTSKDLWAYLRGLVGIPPGTYAHISEDLCANVGKIFSPGAPISSLARSALARRRSVQAEDRATFAATYQLNS